MAKLIAIHSLHLASAVKGTVDVINPGESFDSIESDNVERLKEIGAVRKATDKDASAVKAVRASTGKSSAAAAPADDADLSKMKKADLLALGKAEEIELDENATNADLAKAIQAGRAAKTDSLV